MLIIPAATFYSTGEIVSRALLEKKGILPHEPILLSLHRRKEAACDVVAERFSSADFQHGPIAVIERNFPVFLFAPPGRIFKDMFAVHERLRGLGAETVVISSGPRILRRASRAIAIPDRIDDLLSPIPYIIPGQMFAALLAKAKGLSPDQPRSLHKITQTV